MNKIIILAMPLESNKFNVLYWMYEFNYTSDLTRLIKAYRDKICPTAWIMEIDTIKYRKLLDDENELHIKQCDIDGDMHFIVCNSKAYHTLKHKNQVSTSLIDVITNCKDCVVI